MQSHQAVVVAQLIEPFESSHQQKFMLNIYCQLYWKDENKEKDAENGPIFFKKKQYQFFPILGFQEYKLPSYDRHNTVILHHGI